MRVKFGSAAYIEAANGGYGIGLDNDGHVVEFLADWEELRAVRAGEYLDLEAWQVLTVDEEVRVKLSRHAMAARAAFLRNAMRR